MKPRSYKVDLCLNRLLEVYCSSLMNHFLSKHFNTCFFVHVAMPWFVVVVWLFVLIYDLHDNPYLMDAALLFPYLLRGLNYTHVSEQGSSVAMAVLCYVMYEELEKVVTHICPCILKFNGYYTEKEAFLPLYSFQLQITKSR